MTLDAPVVTIIFALIGVIYYFQTTRTAKLEVKVEAHEIRIQKQEDIGGSEMSNLKENFNEFKKEILGKIDALTIMVHKDKNVENQINQTLTLLLKELEKRPE